MMMGMITKATQRMSSHVLLHQSSTCDLYVYLGEAAAGNVEQELVYAHHTMPETMRRTGN